MCHGYRIDEREVLREFEEEPEEAEEPVPPESELEEPEEEPPLPTADD